MNDNSKTNLVFIKKVSIIKLELMISFNDIVI